MKKQNIKRGRKPKKDQDKVRVRPVYITPKEEKKILSKHTSLTIALKNSVLGVV